MTAEDKSHSWPSLLCVAHLVTSSFAANS